MSEYRNILHDEFMRRYDAVQQEEWGCKPAKKRKRGSMRESKPKQFWSPDGSRKARYQKDQ